MPTSYSWNVSLGTPPTTPPEPPSYSWTVVSDPVAIGPAANVGPYVPSSPMFSDSKKAQFERGVKFANVPGGKPENVVHGGPRIYHVNSVGNVVQTTSDKLDFSGVIKFKNNKNAAFYRVPASVSAIDPRTVDRFGNMVFQFTGRKTHIPLVPPTGSWAAGGTLNKERAFYAGVILSSSQMLIAGGRTSGGVDLTQAEYSYNGTTWTTIAPLPTAKRLAGSAALNNGDFLIVGGFGPDPHEAVKSYRYISGSNTWLSPTIPMFFSASVIDMVKMDDGRVFCAGGLGISASLSFTGSQIYDPSNDSWFAAAPYPKPVPDLFGQSLLKLGNGKIMMVGGEAISIGPGEDPVKSTNYMYDPSLDSWTTLAPIPIPIALAAMYEVIENKVIVFGGYSSALTAINKSYIYDVVYNTWKEGPPMLQNRAVFGSVIFSVPGHSRRITVAGGVNEAGTILNTVETYDSVENKWYPAAPLIDGTRSFILFGNDVTAPNIKLVAPGGIRTGPIYSDNSQLYTTISDS